MHQYYQRNYKFCPKCGQLFTNQGTRLYCGHCGFSAYPNPAPTVCIIVEKTYHNKPCLLMAKRGIEPFKNTWDCFGGFIGAQETLEEAAKREMLEESQVEIINVKYLTSLPDEYQTAPTLTFGVTAQLKPDFKTTQIQPQDDVSAFAWLKIKDYQQWLPEIGFTSVQKIIKQYLKRKDYVPTNQN